MSMIGYFVALDQATLNEVKRAPDLLENYLFVGDGNDQPPPRVSIDKAWHGIHYLLTGTAYGGTGPLSWAVFGGEAIGEDLGYGPARLLAPEPLAAVAAALKEIDVESFRSRYSPEAMEAAQVYPDDIWVREGDEALDYLVSYYQLMVDFYAGAASRGDGAVLFLA
jgi:hypothetical protein